MPKNPRSVDQAVAMLLPAQVEALRVVVAAEQEAFPDGSKGNEFLIVLAGPSVFVMFDQGPQPTIPSVSAAEALARAGAILLTQSRTGGYRGSITSLGYAVASEATDEVGHQEAARATYLDGDAFRTRHPRAYDAWRRAAARLESHPDHLGIRGAGADCREAIQIFADDLVRAYGLMDQVPDVSKTKNRIRTVIESQRASLSSRESQMLVALSGLLDAHFTFFDAVEGATQAGTHSGDNQQSERTLGQARRLVFLVMVMMAEVDSTLMEFAPV